jgi:hypothetical protein
MYEPESHEATGDGEPEQSAGSEETAVGRPHGPQGQAETFDVRNSNPRCHGPTVTRGEARALRDSCGVEEGAGRNLVVNGTTAAAGPALDPLSLAQDPTERWRLGKVGPIRNAAQSTLELGHPRIVLRVQEPRQLGKVFGTDRELAGEESLRDLAP